jgi:hypothetical protein
MYKFRKNISNIDSYSVCDYNLVTYSKKGSVFLNEKVFFIENEIILGAYLDKECLLNVVTNDEVYWYYKFHLFLITKHLSGFLDLKTEKNLRLFRNENQNYCYYDLEKKEVVQTYKAKFSGLYPSAYSNECLFIHKFPNPIISSLSLLTGEYEWEVDLGGRKYLDDSQAEKEANITEIIGIWENQLLVVMDSGELISIDIHTGKILWSKNVHLRHWDTTEVAYPVLRDWRNRSQFWRNYWHLENGYLYNLDGNVYYRVSLATQTLEILWQDDLSKEEYLTFSHKTYTEDYIYFTGSYNRALSPYLLGVFNRKTLAVEWLYDFGDALANQGDYAHSLNQAPQVAGNKLYVLDSGGTLHIFEREG